MTKLYPQITKLCLEHPVDALHKLSEQIPPLPSYLARNDPMFLTEFFTERHGSAFKDFLRHPEFDRLDPAC